MKPFEPRNNAHRDVLARIEAVTEAASLPRILKPKRIPVASKEPAKGEVIKPVIEPIVAPSKKKKSDTSAEDALAAILGLDDSELGEIDEENETASDAEKLLNDNGEN